MNNQNVFYDELCLSIYTTNRYFHQLYQIVLGKYELTYLQYMVLLNIKQQGKSTLVVICRNLDLDTNTLTPVVKKLMIKNWIKREKSVTDGRSFELFLTNSAEQKFELIQIEIARIQEKLVGDDQQQFTKILSQTHTLNNRVQELIDELTNKK
ncbi:MarR family winged helix-turn-helix transcriptional regulator [Liquorilactobacillus mali]|uniref:HTH-type transcriptional regulator SarZ n=1 Tax=Liquorilactobacillus mali KCTC 3596 = DSM 20444 TaxID=1046596 RepID=J1F041_9LACO|nr:MarR family transcriptional regulator [Liquorilactobacillus mali]EJE97281.1 MarR family transcriptional regulator [Liquorilactobacillus mali KCTC 3596 = DSM 20444]KRN11332.1 MarR family transcriptional regulator [Liquorilactobacillus mali KCTC 3596 = DSM 20444]MDC7953163.1 MarR family transcriptional regulator [Liquorilactobacillus mali]MDV7757244.1 MarR family transcriptional regulator [Liquorilactobacillus mali]QFQ75332.1 MarR family transcriptional regulator [Liquorilactobacillus mali]